jgi:hypothetical protein
MILRIILFPLFKEFAINNRKEKGGNGIEEVGVRRGTKKGIGPKTFKIINEAEHTKEKGKRKNLRRACIDIIKHIFRFSFVKSSISAGNGLGIIEIRR